MHFYLKIFFKFSKKISKLFFEKFHTFRFPRNHQKKNKIKERFKIWAQNFWIEEK